MAKKSNDAGRGSASGAAAAPERAKPAAGVAPTSEPAEKLLEWVKQNRTLVYTLSVIVLVAALGTWSYVVYQRNKESQAQRELEQARFSVQAGNLALAASDLSRLVASRSGTRSADEAVIVLATVRLMQGDATVAASELRAALDRGIDPEFTAPAYGLLGSALENIGNLAEAGDAYERAADASWYDYVAAQYLVDAGRAFWAAGDTAQAAAAYERTVRDYEDASAATEARVRLGELRAPR